MKILQHLKFWLVSFGFGPSKGHLSGLNFSASSQCLGHRCRFHTEIKISSPLSHKTYHRHQYPLRIKAYRKRSCMKIICRDLLYFTFLLGTCQVCHQQQNDESKQVVVGRASVTAKSFLAKVKYIDINLKGTERAFTFKVTEGTTCFSYFIDDSSSISKFLHVFNGWKAVT